MSIHHMLHRLQAPCLFVALCLLPFGRSAQGQTLLYEDVFAGGVTGAGYSPGTGGLVPGVFDVDIPAGSSIRQAYLMAGRHGPTGPKTVTLNGDPFTFDASNEVSVPFMSPPYGGPSATHAIDVTAALDPTVVTYSLMDPSPAGVSTRFADYYLWIAYDNPSLQPVNASIWINDLDFQLNFDFTVAPSVALDTACGEIALAVFGGYWCNNLSDAELLYIDGPTGLAGTMGGDDFNSGGCGGVQGHFGYRNGTTFGLGDDTPDNTVGDADGLVVVNSYLISAGSPFDVRFQHAPSSSTVDNAVWAFFTVGSAGSGTGAFADAGEDKSICASESVLLDGSGTGSLSWSPAATLDDPLAPTPLASPSATTDYVLTANAGCSFAYDTVTVFVESADLGPDGLDSVCVGDTLSLGPLGDPGITYTWTPDDGFLDPTVSPAQLVVLEGATTYQLIGTTAGGCQDTALFSIAATTPTVDAGADRIVALGAEIQLEGSGTALTWTWSPSDSLSCSNCLDPLFTAYANSTFYLTGTNAFGCAASDSVRIRIDAPCQEDAVLPNAFSPNGDGLNDAFGLPFPLLEESRLSVYNRWGQRVFFSADAGTKWDGTFKGKAAEMGSYIWILEGRCLEGGAYRRMGNVTLIR